MKIIIAVAVTSLFWLWVAWLAYGAGAKSVVQGRIESAGVDWFNDWITITIPAEAFMSFERPVTERSIIEIDLKSGEGVTVSPQLCRDKPKVPLGCVLPTRNI